MRVIAELPHPKFKITLFQWNNRYLIKIEHGFLEQTYKVDQLNLSGEEDLKKLIDEAFLNGVAKRFNEMAETLHEAIQRLENQMN